MHTYMIHAYVCTYIHDTYVCIYTYVCSHISLMPHVARAAVRCMCTHARSIIGLGRGPRMRERRVLLADFTYQTLYDIIKL
jgi:hypothetical protein